MLIDACNRKLDYLRISVTDLCDLRCKYCMPLKGIEKLPHDSILSLEEIFSIAKSFVEMGIKKIRITGGEPLVRRGIGSLLYNIGNIEGLEDFAITTNGQLFEDHAYDIKRAGIKRVNISLDTLDEERYRDITRGGDINKVLRSIALAKELKLSPIRINTVLIDNFNIDEIAAFVDFASREDLEVRFIELMPIGEVLKWSSGKSVPASIILDTIKSLQKEEKSDITSTASYYKIKNSNGKVGLITPMSEKFCKYCNRLRITSDGKLKLCLHSNNELDLKNIIRSGKEIKSEIKKYIMNKPSSHNIEKGELLKKNMVQIGG